MNDIISVAFKKAEILAKTMNAENEIDLLPRSVRTFLLVHAAQGVIDNGGYSYFFGPDWPNQLPYEEFAEAYDEIGCTNQAMDIRRIISSFPFSDPHLQSDKRANYIHDNYDGEALEVRKWGDALCGDKKVWEKLSVFYKKHENDFA